VAHRGSRTIATIAGSDVSANKKILCLTETMLRPVLSFMSPTEDPHRKCVVNLGSCFPKHLHLYLLAVSACKGGPECDVQYGVDVVWAARVDFLLRYVSEMAADMHHDVQDCC
jgi:hypothetical protein